MLVELAPEIGHLAHMATHIDIQIGDYEESIYKNNLGLVADLKYLKYRESLGKSPTCFYLYYVCHSPHFALYSAMFTGQYDVAMKHGHEILKLLPLNVLQDTKGFTPIATNWLEPYIQPILMTYIRFGKW